MASSEPPPLQPGRKRRAHKRSRNGCSTCKQRHIRCDEVKPICTNCLTRGGECGYPEPGGVVTPGSAAGSAAGSGFRGATLGAELFGQRIVPVPSSPADPFDCLPIKMPHRSLELFHHYTHYRIFSRTAVPKNPDSECVGISLSDPGTFRACLLMTTLNYSWLSGPGSLQSTDMEETYLYHKLEAMRIVNEQIADPVQSTSDGCLSLIAALALVESGMGDHVAAEAHLNGLFTLLDMKSPEEWQHRIYGLLQRIILAIGSYIAAAKSLEGGAKHRFTAGEVELGIHDHVPHFTRPPSPLFSTAPMIATRLSPFYYGSSPCVEACKADVEGLVLINALRRLSSLPVIDPPAVTAANSRSSSMQPDHPGSPHSITADRTENYHLSPDATATLLADTDSYIGSLLFKPQPLYRSHHYQHLRPSPSLKRTSPLSRSVSPATTTPAHATFQISTAEAMARDKSDATAATPAQRTDPYADLPAELFPSSSRAWATAGYLYLHVLLSPLFHASAPSAARNPSPSPSSKKRKRYDTSPANRVDAIDPHLLRLLLDTLRADVQHTEEAMRIGAYSSELWLWKVVVGAYTVEVAGVGLGVDHGPSFGYSSGCFSGASSPSILRDGRESDGANRRAKRGEETTEEEKGNGSLSFFGWIVDGTMEGTRAGGEQKGGNTSADLAMDESDGEMETEAEVESQREEARTRSGAWFDERLRAWSRAAHVTDWTAARQMLARIVWPEQQSGLFEGEAVVERLWRRAVGGDGVEKGEEGRRKKERERKLPMMIAVDPRLM